MVPDSMVCHQKITKQCPKTSKINIFIYGASVDTMWYDILTSRTVKTWQSWKIWIFQVFFSNSSFFMFFVAYLRGWSFKGPLRQIPDDITKYVHVFLACWFWLRITLKKKSARHGSTQNLLKSPFLRSVFAFGVSNWSQITLEVSILHQKLAFSAN